MDQKTRQAGGSTAAVLWLMIMLVFLPIAIGHIVARQTADGSAATTGSGPQSGAPPAG